MFALEDETERGLDYHKGNPTEGFESIFELHYYDANQVNYANYLIGKYAS